VFSMLISSSISFGDRDAVMMIWGARISFRATTCGPWGEGDSHGFSQDSMSFFEGRSVCVLRYK